ncbi:MAG: type II toxin-antitoxin system VapC family toxin [Polyangiales bacterium]
MSLRYLLDTNVVSAPVSTSGNPRVVRKLSDVGTECAIAAPVWHELVFGTERLPPGRRRVALEAYLTDVVRPSFPVLPYDEAAAAWHGRERARLSDLGHPPPFVDGQIAAIARTRGLVLVTANTKDFERFEGLRLEDWTKPTSRAGRRRGE